MIGQIHASSMEGISLDNQRFLIEGLSHTAAALPGGQAEDTVMLLTRPFARHIQEAIDSAMTLSGGDGTRQPSPAARHAVTHGLLLLAASLKSLLPASLAQGSSGGGAAVCVMRGVENTLSVLAASPAWQRDEEVMEALVEMAKQAVCSARRKSFEVCFFSYFVFIVYSVCLIDCMLQCTSLKTT